MNIFYYDPKKISMETLQSIFAGLCDTLGRANVIALPNSTHLIEDCPIEQLTEIRDVLNKIIDKNKQTAEENV